jgi:hypothetical protein
MRSLCVGFWAVNTIAICIRTVLHHHAKYRGCIMLQEVRSSLWPVSFPVYASIVSFGLRLLYNCNTRYEWLVRPCSPGTFTLEETPSFAWRTNGVRYPRVGGTRQHPFDGTGLSYENCLKTRRLPPVGCTLC